mgnify:CR=1 FL=1|jgi:uncharacterized membrane protein YczE
MGFLSLLRPSKKVPITWWSSDNPLNVKPKFSTLLIIIAGEWIFGTGDAVLITAGIGNTPWTVLAEGLSDVIGRSIGQATFIVSVCVLFLWIPLREKIGIGTILNVIFIALAIEIMVPILPTPESYWLAVLQVAIGVLLVGIGSTLYLTANLGPGPRDGLMTGLQRVSGRPIGKVRIAIEVTVLSFGILLGGTFGLGTILFALLIGPVVAIFLNVAGTLCPAS